MRVAANPTIEMEESDVVLEACGMSFRLCCLQCSNCDYPIIFAALPEHEPTYCPNCGAKLNWKDLGVKPFEPKEK